MHAGECYFFCLPPTKQTIQDGGQKYIFDCGIIINDSCGCDNSDEHYKNSKLLCELIKHQKYILLFLMG